MDSTNWTAIGRITKAHGLKGEIRLQLDFTFLFPDKLPTVFYIESAGNEPIQYFIASGDIISNQHAIIHFEEVKDRNTAQMLQGKKVYLPDDKTTDFEIIANDSLFNDVEGFTIMDTAGKIIGTIKEVQWLPAHPVALLENPPEQLIPLHEDFLVEKNIEQKQLVLNLPDGLADLLNT